MTPWSEISCVDLSYEETMVVLCPFNRAPTLMSQCASVLLL